MNPFNPRHASFGRKQQSRGSSPRGFQGGLKRTSYRGSQKRRGPGRNKGRKTSGRRFNKPRYTGKKQKKFYAVLAEGGVIFTEWKACQIFINDRQRQQKDRVRFKSFPIKAEAEAWIKSDGKKFYAVFNQKTREGKIFTDWTKCQELINSLIRKKFKSFPNEEAAKAWIARGGKPPKKFYVVINPHVKAGGVIFTDWKACQSYMKRMPKTRGQRVKYKSFTSEPEATKWLSLGGLVFKTMKSLETNKPYHVSWKTYLIQKYKLIPQELLQSLMINVDPRMRGEGNKMVNNENPMQYSGLMGVFIDFLMMRELCIQKKQSFVAKAAHLSLKIFTPYMIKYDRSVKIRNEPEASSTVTTQPKKLSRYKSKTGLILESETPMGEGWTLVEDEEPESVPEVKPVDKKMVGYGLERDLLHQFNQDVEKQFTEIVATMKKAIETVEDLTKSNLNVLNQALLLCQFEKVARNENYDPKEIDLNFHYINPILTEITKMIAFILKEEAKRGSAPLYVQPDLSSKTTKAECDFIIGDTIFDFKCLFSIANPMMSMERSLIQYLLYAAMANDPDNKLNENYEPITKLAILLPIQRKIIHVDLAKVPFDQIRKSFYL